MTFGVVALLPKHITWAIWTVDSFLCSALRESQCRKTEYFTLIRIAKPQANMTQHETPSTLDGPKSAKNRMHSNAMHHANLILKLFIINSVKCLKYLQSITSINVINNSGLMWRKQIRAPLCWPCSVRDFFLFFFRFSGFSASENVCHSQGLHGHHHEI